MNRIVNSISGRLSLRPPQREALELLDRVTEIVPPTKSYDLGAALATIHSEYPSVTDFERDFPSLCFALATGVGKTRLMGAFISYLYLAKGIKNFFVLAPNLTIYNKLVADFTANTPKYVFQGIAEFATAPPEIITGDNYESGRGTRIQGQLFGGDVHINIFNISKINAEVRGGSAPRIKRLQEYIGQSYFDYLSALPDLVLIMDESHRYRASAGIRAINELKPILGLELTATPYIEAGAKAPIPFRNTIYSYPLSTAMVDGFVKEPAAATRENFNASSYSGKDGEQRLELLKLEDGVRIHENTKVELEVFARQHDLPIVKPFMLVVARDTDHANQLVRTISSDAFFEGRYKGRVITVHSNQRGDEKDETIERLLTVERPEEPTEIVVHVNKLKEGWDVTNLYTIVPLRAAKSEILVEQTIGRGLRLPYGKRVGVPAVDRLTIVAHEHFQAIIDEANNPNSIIRSGIVIGRDIPIDGKQTIIVQPTIQAPASATPTPGTQQTLVFENPEERRLSAATIEVIRRFERLPRSYDLQKPDVRAMIVAEVRSSYGPVQAELEGMEERPDIETVVAKTVEHFIEHSIDIPRITVVPTGEVSSGFSDFDLIITARPQPVAKDILIHHLQSNTREKLVSGDGIVEEARPEDYLVRALMDYDDVSYDDHADLLYKLAGQAVAHLRSYLKDDEELLNVLQYHQRQLAELIHTQMQDHHWERASGYEVRVSKGFTTLRTNSFTAAAGEKVRDFRAPVDSKRDIRGMVFGGFRRCLYPQQKFDTDKERLFATILEDDADVLKWFKPAPGQLQLYYRYRIDRSYEPDFIVETKTAKYMCEPKMAKDMDDPEVLAKAAAAANWCKHATDHEKASGGKPWHYLLIPDNAIDAAKTLAGLAATYEFSS